MDSDSFAGHPQTIGEARADKTDSCHDWTPRDVLVRMLRQIDEGAEIDTVIICYRQVIDDKVRAKYWLDGGDALVALGLMSRASVDLALP